MNTLPTCSCGRFAVGFCKCCGEPVCHEDSHTVDGALECRSHAAARAEAQRDREHSAYLRMLGEQRDELARFLERMRQAGFPGAIRMRCRGAMGEGPDPHMTMVWQTHVTRREVADDFSSW